MTPEQFCFWLHGYFELTGDDVVTPEQAKMIREHLDLVFTKVTPPLDKPKRDLLQEEVCEVSPGAKFVLRNPGPGRIC